MVQLYVIKPNMLNGSTVASMIVSSMMGLALLMSPIK